MSKKIKKTEQELIFGIHPIIELLKAKKRSLITIYTTKPEPKAWNNIKKLLPKRVPVQYVSRNVLHNMAGTTDHQGVIAWAKPFIIRKKPFNPKQQSFLLMLDGLQDPRNLGAILRSAYCTGVQGVVIIKKGAAPINAVALKSSAGLAEHLDIAFMPSAKHAAQELKDAGYKLYLAVPEKDAQQAQDIQYVEPLCLVIGGEGFGISKSIFSFGEHVLLPQKTADISYNASVAAGILLFLISVQLKKI